MKSRESRKRSLRQMDGFALAAEIKRLGLSQKEVAEMLKVTEAAVSLGLNERNIDSQFRPSMRSKIVDLLSSHSSRRKHTAKLSAA